jgi:hypothetical protein
MPATGCWCSWCLRRSADRGWPGSAQAGSICRPGAVTVAEILTEVKGRLIAPAQDARRPADRRAAALCGP